MRTGEPVFETCFYPSEPISIEWDELERLIPEVRIHLPTDNLADYPMGAPPCATDAFTSDGWIVRASDGSSGWALGPGVTFLDRQRYWEDADARHAGTLGAEGLAERVCLLLHLLHRCAEELKIVDAAPFSTEVRLAGTEGRRLVAKVGADLSDRHARRPEVFVPATFTIGDLRRDFRRIAGEIITAVARQMERTDARPPVVERWLAGAERNRGPSTLFPGPSRLTGRSGEDMRNPFDRVLNDRVSLVKSTGERVRDEIKSAVDSSKGRIIIFDVDLPIEEGDFLERQLPNGTVERFEVEDPGFQQGLSRIPPSFNVRVRKVTKRPRRVESPSNVTINQYGPNSRVNQDSVDRSANVASNVTVNWTELREAIERGVAAEAERAALVGKVSELEKASGTPSFADRYKEFMALAANHMTVLAPFLGPLTSLL